MNRGADSQKSSRGGYTIVETLIFLAVSGLLLVTAMLFLSGRQARQQFQTAVRDFETKVADIANDVSNGYYQNGTPLDCQAGPSGLTITSGSLGLGANTPCIFIGTVLKLGSGTSEGSEEIIQYTMAGRRLNSSNADVASLAEATPTVIGVENTYSTSRIGAGIKIQCVSVEGRACSASNNAGIGFFTTFKGSDVSQSGSTTSTNVISYNSISIGENDTSTQAKLNTQSFYASPQLNPKITICLLGDGTDQYALVHIGGSGSSSLTVTSEIKSFSGATPPCN